MATSQASTSKNRAGCLGCALRMGVGGVILVSGLLGVGYAYQGLGLQSDAAHFPAPGQRVDIGGRALHLWCVGTASVDRPTVVLEAGLGRASLDWRLVLDHWEGPGQACAYDRAGYGWSDPGPEPRSVDQNVTDLHALLQAASLDGPVVLVGHSYGGALVLRYAAHYPDSVRGVVLVDALHEQEWVGSSEAEQQSLAQQQGQLATIALLNRFGILRAFGSLMSSGSLPVPVGALNAQDKAAYGSFLLRSSHYETWLSEVQALQNAAPGDALEAGFPKDVPLIILTAQLFQADVAADQSAAETDHLSWQSRFLDLSSRSRQIMVAGGHDLPLQQPASVLDAIHALQSELTD